MFVGRRFLFFHVPKAAGTTIQRSLVDYLLNCFVWEVREREDKRLIYMDHVAYPDYLQIKELTWTRAHLKCCFVRNPYDRAYSAFVQHCHYVRTLPQVGLLDRYPTVKRQFEEEYRTASELTFTDFMQRLPQRLEDYRDDNYLYVNFYPQHCWTHDDGRSVLDFVGRVEDFRKDFSAMCRFLGLKTPRIRRALIRKRPRRSRDLLSEGAYKYLNQYSSEALEIVDRVYQEDFRLFGYPRVARVAARWVGRRFGGREGRMASGRVSR
ncbi:MAG: sulfotransferase family 2 domain-containing protein [Gemmatimonadota bacterium]